MAVVPRDLTLEEFFALPEQEPPLEYADRVVPRRMTPKGRRGAIQSEFAERVNTYGRRRKLAGAFSEARISFGGRSRVPAVVVHGWARIPRDARGRVPDDFVDPPDVAIEIISPRQSPRAVATLRAWYVANGVPLAPLVDPDAEAIVAYQPGARRRGARPAAHGAGGLRGAAGRLERRSSTGEW